MSFTRDWDESTPTNADYAHELDDFNRNLRVDVSDRLKALFYGFTAGENSSEVHCKYLQFKNQSSVALPSAGYGRAYTKSAGGVSELHYQGDDGNEKQITNGGQLNIVSADIPADTVDDTHIEVRNDQYLVASDAAGTGDVPLIKANTSDEPTLPDGARLATSAAPDADAEIANKKYVDDHATMVPAVTGAGAGYAGEESVTFPNGMILKSGHSATPTGDQDGSGVDTVAITFGAPFPHGLLAVTASLRENTGTICTCIIAASASGFTFGYREAKSLSQTMAGFDWIAIGY
jgi:hypothetical protein